MFLRTLEESLLQHLIRTYTKLQPLPPPPTLTLQEARPSLRCCLAALPKLRRRNARTRRHDEAIVRDTQTNEDILPRCGVGELAEQQLKRAFVEELFVANDAALDFLELVIARVLKKNTTSV